jgi:hypothetical protein
MKPEELNVEVENFVKCVEELIYNDTLRNFPNLLKKSGRATVEIKNNTKYYKLISNKSVWGFISKVDGIFKGSPIKVGDLLMPASWSTPAKHSRGNILDNTACYGVYGPTYLK